MIEKITNSSQKRVIYYLQITNSCIEDNVKIEIVELSDDETDEKLSQNEVCLPKGVETANWLNQLAKVVYSWYTDK